MEGEVVYTGFWVNHSRNVILGSTITLTETNGFYLSNFLSLLVTIAGQSFWTITSYFIHQLRCEYQPQRPLFYQQQAVLRNSGSALTAALRLAQLSFNWRPRYRTPRSQIAHFISPTPVYITVALSVAIGFGLASVFSSHFTKAATTGLLLDPVECGFFELREESTVKNAKQFLLADAEAARYAACCYSGESKIGCESNIVKFIPSATASIETCPFRNKICIKSPNSAYQMATGMVDSNDMLGLNAKKSERLQIRKVATCSPINPARFFNNTIEPFPARDGCFRMEAVERYYFGPLSNNAPDKSKNRRPKGSKSGVSCSGIGETTNGTQSTPSNFTFQYNRLAQIPTPGYNLRVFHSEFGQKFPKWFPIPELRRDDADVALFVLASNEVKYRSMTSDPFFKTTNVTSGDEPIQFVTGDSNSKSQFFRSSRPITLIGCIDQYQVCDPNTRNSTSGSSSCTVLGPALNISNAVDTLKLNPFQIATLRILGHQLKESGIYNSVSSLGVSALRAAKTSYAINDDYVQIADINELWWQSEVYSWFQASLASLQLNLVKMVSERPFPKKELPPRGFCRLTDAYEKEICHRQKLRARDGFQNFSTVRVVLVVFLSIQLIVVGLHIHLIGGAIQQLMFKNRYSRAAWSSDGYLQLQRQAYEGAGYEGWENCADDDIPVLRDVERLGGLDIMNLRHPRLARAPPDASDLSPSESTQSEKDKKSRGNLPYIPSRSASVKKPSDRDRPLPPLPLQTSGLSRAGTWLSSTTLHH